MAISENVPTYRQLDPNGFFCPEGYLIMENEAFEFDGEPNENMEALNEPARKSLLGLYKKLDEAAKAAAEKHGRIFTSRARELDVLVAEATADARRIELRPGDGGIPLTSARVKGDVHVKKVDLEAAQPVIRRGRPRNLLVE